MRKLASAGLPTPLLARPQLTLQQQRIIPSLLLPLASPRRYYSVQPTPGQSTSSSSSAAAPSPAPQPVKRKSPEEKLGLSARLKALFRKHGWTALAIYLILSLLDFGLTFIFIYAIGADKVRAAEDWVLETLGGRRKDGEKGRVRKAVEEWKDNHPRVTGKKTAPKEEQVDSSQATTAEGPVEKTVDKLEDKGYSSIATTAVLAYAIHKTLLLPLRVGVTVSLGCLPPRSQSLNSVPSQQIAITPRIVRTLQSYVGGYLCVNSVTELTRLLASQMGVRA